MLSTDSFLPFCLSFLILLFPFCFSKVTLFIFVSFVLSLFIYSIWYSYLFFILNNFFAVTSVRYSPNFRQCFLLSFFRHIYMEDECVTNMCIYPPIEKNTGYSRVKKCINTSKRAKSWRFSWWKWLREMTHDSSRFVMNSEHHPHHNTRHTWGTWGRWCFDFT